MKKNIKLVVGVLAFSICIGLPAVSYAAQSGAWTWRGNTMQSHGRVEYYAEDNNTTIPDIVVDAADIETIALQVDTLEETYKQGIVDAVNALDKGNAVADVSATDGNGNYRPYSELMDEILNSQASSAVPSADQLLSGKEVWANGNKITGTMINNGTTGAANLTAGKSYTIPAGYTSGGTVTTATLASQTSGTATADNLSAGVTAWVNGTKITGTGGDNNAYYTQGKAEARTGIICNTYTTVPLNDMVAELKPGNYSWYYHGWTPYWHSIKLKLSDGTVLKDIKLECYDANDSNRHKNMNGNFTISEGQTLTAEVTCYNGDFLFVIMPID